MNPISLYIENIDYDYMYNVFGMDGDAVPIYFYHKITNEFGSSPRIYNQIIKYPTSRYKIYELKILLSYI